MHVGAHRDQKRASNPCRTREPNVGAGNWTGVLVKAISALNHWVVSLVPWFIREHSSIVLKFCVLAILEEERLNGIFHGDGELWLQGWAMALKFAPSWLSSSNLFQVNLGEAAQILRWGTWVSMENGILNSWVLTPLIRTNQVIDSANKIPRKCCVYRCTRTLLAAILDLTQSRLSQTARGHSHPDLTSRGCLGYHTSRMNLKQNFTAFLFIWLGLGSPRLWDTYKQILARFQA